MWYSSGVGRFRWYSLWIFVFGFILALSFWLAWPFDFTVRIIKRGWQLSIHAAPFQLTILGIVSLIIAVAIKWIREGLQAVIDHMRKILWETLVPSAAAVFLCFFLYNVIYTVPMEIYREAVRPNQILRVRFPPVPEFAWTQQAKGRSGAKGQGDHGYIEALLTKISGSWELTVFNEGKDPFDNVGLSIMQSPQGPDGKDTSKIMKAVQDRISMDIGTLRVHDVKTVGPLPMSLWPDSNKPTMYQILIYTRYVRFQEWLFASPKNGFVDQGIDVVNIDTSHWYVKKMEEALRRWHNYPEWWK